MLSTISVCIPTRNRVDLLEIAVKSCFDQDYRPIEIVIGDDSDGPETEQWLRSLVPPDGITIRYERNAMPLGQSANVNRLFDRASGDMLLLLHDDDFLCPGGLDILAERKARAPDALCVYGVQWIVDPWGTDMPDATAAWSARYFRVPGHEGPQPSALVAALWQQVPNNCYLMNTALARQTRCKPESEIGHCVDADFVIRASLEAPAGSFVFVDKLISKYRLTPASIARSKTLNRRQDLLFDSITGLPGGDDVQAAKEIILTRIAVGSALDAAMAGRSIPSLNILLSRYYDLPFFSRWTIYRMVCAFSPPLALFLKKCVKRFAHADELPGKEDLRRISHSFTLWAKHAYWRIYGMRR